MAPSLTIYVHYMSQPCRSVGLLCRAIDVPFNDQIINLREAEHKSPEYLAINPFGKVPAVKDGDLLINESCTSLRYIASKYDKTGQWYPTDLAVRAKVDEYLDWQHTNTRKHGVGYFMNKILVPLRTQQPYDEAVVSEHQQELGRVEKQFVEYFLASKPFIAGDHMTIADLAAACEFEQPLAGGYDLSPPIREYMKRVKGALGPSYDEVTKILYVRVNEYTKK